MKRGNPVLQLSLVFLLLLSISALVIAQETNKTSPETTDLPPITGDSSSEDEYWEEYEDEYREDYRDEYQDHDREEYQEEYREEYIDQDKVEVIEEPTEVTVVEVVTEEAPTSVITGSVFLDYMR